MLLALPLAVPATLAAAAAPAAQAGSGVGVVPQGTQSNASYAASFAAAQVMNTDATSGQVSCYRPEVPYFASDGPNDGYTGMSACPPAGATTGAGFVTPRWLSHRSTALCRWPASPSAHRSVSLRFRMPAFPGQVNWVNVGGSWR